MNEQRRTPPKHLKNTGAHERMPARPNDRLENERQRQETRQQEKRRGEHSSHENVVETPDNTKLFYDKLLPLAQTNHKKNQRFLRAGIIWLFALPVILFTIRHMTGGNKIAFLIAWIIGMFIIASFLIIVAYQDEVLQRSLDELQEYVPEVEENQLGRLKLIYPPEELEWIEDIDRQLIIDTLKQEHRLPPLESILPGHETTETKPVKPEPVVPVTVEAEPEIVVPVIVEAEPEIVVPATVEAEPEIVVPVTVEVEPETVTPVTVEAEPKPEVTAAAKAKSELIEKISEEYRLELEALEPEKTKPDGGKWVTESAELMWQHINDQTFNDKGGTGDA
jgi:hypothetical protein